MLRCLVGACYRICTDILTQLHTQIYRFTIPYNRIYKMSAYPSLRPIMLFCAALYDFKKTNANGYKYQGEYAHKIENSIPNV